eukprot:PhF_6_TR23331/c0_g1_i1/m.33041
MSAEVVETETFKIVTLTDVCNYSSTDEPQYFAEFARTPAMNYIKAHVSWHDQGWGNRKGRIGIEGFQDNLFPDVAPHEDGFCSAEITDCSGLPEQIRLYYIVGGGGGHSITINKFGIVFAASADDADVTTVAQEIKSRGVQVVQQPVICPRYCGQPLTPWTSSSWSCDKCGQYGNGGTSMACRNCNFDACESCYQEMIRDLESGVGQFRAVSVVVIESREAESESLLPREPEQQQQPEKPKKSKEEIEIEELAAKRLALQAKLEAARAAKARKQLKEAEKRVPNDQEKTAIRAVFDKYDTDKSGFLDLGELRFCVKDLGCTMNDSELHFALQEMDANKDGEISFDEFLDWWCSDKKLGGNSGVQLAMVRARLVGQIALAELESRRVMKIETLSEEVNTTSFTVRTSEAFEPKTAATVSVLPVSKPFFDEAMSEWTRQYAFAPRANEDGNNMEGGICVTFVLNDGVSKEAAEAHIKTVMDLMDAGMSSRDRRKGAFKPVVEGNKVKLYMFIYERPPWESALKQVTKVYGQTPETFDSALLFEQLSFAVETGLDVAAVVNNLDDKKTRVSNVLDNFAVTAKLGVRKHAIEYILVDVMQKMFSHMFRPGPELASLFGGFMSSSISSTVVLSSWQKTQQLLAGHLADRYRCRFDAVWPSFISKIPEAQKENIQLAESLVKEGDNLERFFEGMIQSAFQGDVPINFLTEMMYYDIGRDARSAQSMLGWTAVVNRVETVQLMTPVFGVKADITSGNFFSALPNDDAKMRRAKAIYEQGRNTDERQATPEIKLYNDKKSLFKEISNSVLFNNE